ncbi:MAG: nitroreductase family protein [bacterium]|nr:nitroreductase family protein [bacterium]
MKVIEAIKNRRSVRLYSGKKVSEVKLKRVLEAGRLAPSARNIQEWKFVVVRDKEILRKLSVAANNQEFIGRADSVIVGCSEITDYVMRCGQTAYPIDVAIAMTQMTIQAVEEGLGTCWIGSFYEDQVKRILNIPAKVRIVQMLTLGYPEEKPEPRPRKDFDEVFYFNEWKEF